MPPLHLLWPFLIATVIFAAMPGPAVLYSAAQTLVRGRRSGFMTVLGIHVGGYAYVVATALGLSALLHYVPSVYFAVKMAGAIYLVWLGIGMLRGNPDLQKPAGVAHKSAGRSFRDGLAVELLNPKTAIFFVAFLPQFADPGAPLPVAVQLLVLGVFVNLAFSCTDIITVLAASMLMRRLNRQEWSQRLARIVGGSILIGLGARLATARG